MSAQFAISVVVLIVLPFPCSGGIDLTEYTKWFRRQKNIAANGGTKDIGMFGGLFSTQPLSMSDSYVQLNIKLRKKEEELSRVRDQSNRHRWLH